MSDSKQKHEHDKDKGGDSSDSEPFFDEEEQKDRIETEEDRREREAKIVRKSAKKAEKEKKKKEKANEKIEKKEKKALEKQFKHSKNKHVKKYFGYLGIAAAALAGFQTFLYGMIINDAISNNAYSLFFANFAAYFIFFGLYHVKQAIYAYCKHGSFWSKERSAYIIVKEVERESLKKHEGVRLMLVTGTKKLSMNKFNLFMVCIRGLLAGATTIVRLIAFYTEALSNQNYTRISNIIVLEPMLVGLTFYLVYEEKLKTFDFVGTFLVVGSAIVRGVSIYATSSTTTTGSISGVIPVMLAIVQIFLDTICCLLMRYMVKRTDMRAQQIIADGFLWEGLVFMSVFLYIGFPDQQSIFWAVTALSLLGIFSVFLVNMVIAFGKAAPGLALYCSSFLITIALEVFYLKASPTWIQDIAFMIGLGGVALIFAQSRIKKTT